MNLMPRRRTASGWAILLIAALVAVSCSSDGGEEVTDPPASTTTTTEALDDGDTEGEGDEEPAGAPIPDWPLDDTPSASMKACRSARSPTG